MSETRYSLIGDVYEMTLDSLGDAWGINSMKDWFPVDVDESPFCVWICDDNIIISDIALDIVLFSPMDAYMEYICGMLLDEL